MISTKEWCIVNQKKHWLKKYHLKHTNQDLSEIPFFTKKYYWWECKHHHHWRARPYTVFAGGGCPYCAHRLVSKEYNLAVCYPKLAKEWDYLKNGDLKPEEFLPSVNQKIWWKCQKGHSWRTTINSRARGTGCPYCSHLYASKDFNLLTERPDLAQEWDYEKNGMIKPEDILPNTSRKFFWKCSHQHSWYASPNVRVRSGCPYCSHNLPSKEYNLKVLFPELVEEWDQERNSNNPEDYLPFSEIKVWWCCPNNPNHHFYSSIASRHRNPRGCPICRKKLGTSFPEQAIFYYLKKLFPNTQNRVKIEKKEFDILIPDLNLVIEYDGILYHHKKKEKRNDQQKNKILKKNHFTLLRIKECKFLKKGNFLLRNRIYCRIDTHYLYLNHVISTIIKYINRKYRLSISLIPDIEQDGLDIYNQFVFLQKKDSLASKYPLVAKEWHPTKNGSLTPEMVSPNTKIKVWWKCSKNHEWMAAIGNRAGLNHNCPYCSNQRANDENSLAKNFPQVAKFWDEEKNNPLTPNDVTPGSGKIVWWKCEYQHSWLKMVRYMKDSPKCPICKNQKKFD